MHLLKRLLIFLLGTVAIFSLSAEELLRWGLSQYFLSQQKNFCGTVLPVLRRSGSGRIRRESVKSSGWRMECMRWKSPFHMTKRTGAIL